APATPKSKRGASAPTCVCSSTTTAPSPSSSTPPRPETPVGPFRKGNRKAGRREGQNLHSESQKLHFSLFRPETFAMGVASSRLASPVASYMGHEVAAASFGSPVLAKRDQ